MAVTNVETPAGPRTKGSVFPVNSQSERPRRGASPQWGCVRPGDSEAERSWAVSLSRPRPFSSAIMVSATFTVAWAGWP
eukprot:11174686-Lingulodinium_polyedra.AAC.1